MCNSMTNKAHMSAAACAEADFSCGNDTALIMDAIMLASILFAILGILGLRLRGLMNLLGLRNTCYLKGSAPTFA